MFISTFNFQTFQELPSNLEADLEQLMDEMDESDSFHEAANASVPVQTPEPETSVAPTQPEPVGAPSEPVGAHTATTIAAPTEPTSTDAETSRAHAKAKTSVTSENNTSASVPADSANTGEPVSEPVPKPSGECQQTPEEKNTTPVGLTPAAEHTTAGATADTPTTEISPLKVDVIGTTPATQSSIA